MVWIRAIILCLLVSEATERARIHVPASDRRSHFTFAVQHGDVNAAESAGPGGRDNRSGPAVPVHSRDKSAHVSKKNRKRKEKRTLLENAGFCRLPLWDQQVSIAIGRDSEERRNETHLPPAACVSDKSNCVLCGPLRKQNGEEMLMKPEEEGMNGWNNGI